MAFCIHFPAFSLFSELLAGGLGQGITRRNHRVLRMFQQDRTHGLKKTAAIQSVIVSPHTTLMRINAISDARFKMKDYSNLFLKVLNLES